MEVKILKKILLRLKAPFLLNPIRRPGNYSESHLQNKSHYHKSFYFTPGRKLIFDIETEILNKKILDKIDKGSLTHLDFAAGTGRIANIIVEVTETQYLLDISNEMLNQVEGLVAKSKIICRDFRKGVPEIDDGSVDLVTAFRFFPGAELELRESAMVFIEKKLKNGGLLVCNNHRNFWSIPFFFARLSLRSIGDGMTHKEMIQLALKHDNLFLVDSYSTGIIFYNENRTLLPWKVVNKIEYFIFNRLNLNHTLGSNVVYVFKKQAQ